MKMKKGVREGARKRVRSGIEEKRRKRSVGGERKKVQRRKRSSIVHRTSRSCVDKTMTGRGGRRGEKEDMGSGLCG